MNALVWSFFGKIVKIFVDQNRWQALQFWEKGVGSLQNGAPQPHPGNGNMDLYII